jgi:hypothetical protein
MRRDTATGCLCEPMNCASSRMPRRPASCIASRTAASADKDRRGAAIDTLIPDPIHSRSLKNLIGGLAELEYGKDQAGCRVSNSRSAEWDRTGCRLESGARPGPLCQRGLERSQLLQVRRVQFDRCVFDTFSCPASGRMTLTHVLPLPQGCPRSTLLGSKSTREQSVCPESEKTPCS